MHFAVTVQLTAAVQDDSSQLFCAQCIKQYSASTWLEMKENEISSSQEANQQGQILSHKEIS